MPISLLIFLKVLLFSFLLAFSGIVLSQSSSDPSGTDSEITSQIEQLTTDEFDEPPSEEANPSVSIIAEADRLTLEHRLAQNTIIYHEVIIVAIVAIASLLIVLTFMKLNGTCRPREIVITAGLIIIIYSTIILVLVADNQEQIAPAIGVLGAIAGYLFGTASSYKQENGSTERGTKKN